MKKFNRTPGSFLKLIIFFFLLSFLQYGHAQRKTLKKLRGNWRIKSLIQHGDTLFNLDNIDTVAMIKEQFDLMKMDGYDRPFTPLDSSMVKTRVKEQLKTAGSFHLEFHKDSVYLSSSGPQSSEEGKYWLNQEADSLYLRDNRRQRLASWRFHFHPGNQAFTIASEAERMAFIMKRE